MRAAKWIGIILGIYVAIVILFESFLGYVQPPATEMPYPMLVLTTTDESGTHDRRLAIFEADDRIYVSAHHWPRAWYRRILDNPQVSISIEDESNSYAALQISGADYDRVNTEHSLPFLFRLLTGFPPRHIFRLQPLG